MIPLRIGDSSRMLIHLDTDLGGDTDDACALAMLLRWPGVELAGVTTCTEIGGKRAGMARYILHLEDEDQVSVAAGAAGHTGPPPAPMVAAGPPRGCHLPPPDA